ncbi:hypothetical protein ACFV6F_00885, partial [Kitasatospora phosalacinea]
TDNTALNIALHNDLDTSTQTAPFTLQVAAPAVSDAKPLAASLEPAAGQTPLVRDGSGADLKLTVTNNSDQEQDFHPTVTVTPNSANPKNWEWIGFTATAISAPTSTGTRSFGNDNAFTGYVLPGSSMTHIPFHVPAHTTYTWTVTVKVSSALPTDNTALNIALHNDLDTSTQTAPFTLQVAAPAVNHTPSASPSASPSTAPSGTPGTQVVLAAHTSSPAATTGTTPTDVSLASTGGGSHSGALVGAGGALVLLGTGAVLYANRRRTRAQG